MIPAQETPDAPKLSHRAALLREAERTITGGRDETYGGPEDSFGIIAEFWTVYLRNKTKCDLKIAAEDVALMMDLLKTARLIQNPGHADSWLDKAGYAGCGYQCTVQGGPE